MQKQNKLWVSIIVLIIFLGLIVWGNIALAPKEKTENIHTPNEVSVLYSKCGFTLVSPKTLAEITNTSVEAKAIVDNTRMADLGCSWGVFEANAGTVVATNENNQVIGQTYFSTTEEWMTVNPVNYTANLTLSQIPQELTLTFTEDNTADLPNPDTLIIKIK